MKKELVSITKENSKNIAKYFCALTNSQKQQANEIIESDESLSSAFSSKKDDLISDLENNASDNIFNVSKENSYLIKMPFFRQFLTPSQTAHFLRVGLIKKNYELSYLASQQEYTQTIHQDLFYEEVNRLEGVLKRDKEHNTIDKKYLEWYEKLISHLPEEKKMKCLIGLLCVSVSQSYRSAFSDISKKMGFEYQEINDMSMSKRLEIIDVLKEKVNFENWSDELKRKFNGWFKSPLHGLSLHALSQEIDEWVQDLNVVVLHTKLDKGLEDKTTDTRKPKI
jgi:hypothetical protein